MSIITETFLEDCEREKDELLKNVVAFLNKRSQQFYDIEGGLRESVALGEAAIMIENGMWRE